jgi:hypothetical protein
LANNNIPTEYAVRGRMSDSWGKANRASVRRREAERIEAALVRSIQIPGERGRIERRVTRHAQEDPSEMVSVLLRNYSHRNKRVSAVSRELLGRLTATERE